MLRRIKYLLLRWLLYDICNRSECESCRMREIVTFESGSGETWSSYSCREGDVFWQARKAWKMDKE